MSVVVDCANVVLKDHDGNSGLVRSLTDNDVSKINTGLTDVADLKTRVKAVEDNGYVSYNSLQTLDEDQCSQAQANMDAPGLSVNNTFTGKMTVESDVKADSFTLNTRSDYAKLSASTNTYGVKVLGGSTETTGASIVLNSSTDTDTDVANSFNIVAKDNVKLHGAPDGTLTWNSANVVRAVNNVPADAKGNVLLGTEKSTFNKVTFETDYFTVGTNTTTAFDLTDTDLELIDKERINIRILAKVTTEHNGFKVGDIAQITTGIAYDNQYGNLDVCTYIRGNIIYLYSGNDNDLSIQSISIGRMKKNSVELKLVLTAFVPDDGSILLIAEDQENSCSLVGLPDGTLTWGGVNIVRTVNGVEADSDGNVEISASGVAYIIKTYHSDKNWYRVWSDGFIEQGGYSSTTSSQSLVTISFNKAFTTTTYSINAIVKTTEDTEGGHGLPKSTDMFCSLKSRSTSNAVIAISEYSTDNSIEGVIWYACGY